jgi:hypothetical protein
MGAGSGTIGWLDTGPAFGWKMQGARQLLLNVIPCPLLTTIFTLLLTRMFLPQL